VTRDCAIAQGDEYGGFYLYTQSIAHYPLFNWFVAQGYEDGGILFKWLKLSLDGGPAHPGK
jgi:hypothetical protein